MNAEMQQKHKEGNSSKDAHHIPTQAKTLTNKGRKQGPSTLLQQAEGFEFVAAALNHLTPTKQNADFTNKF